MSMRTMVVELSKMAFILIVGVSAALYIHDLVGVGIGMWFTAFFYQR